MTDQLRQAAQRALKALLSVKNHGWDEDTHTGRALITTLRKALEQAELAQENPTLREWKEQGEAIMAQAGVGFWHKLWWADRPWRK